MLGLRIAAFVTVVGAWGTGCGAGSGSPGASGSPEPHELFSAPTSSAFTAAPFTAPTDGPSFWASLEQIVPALDPSAQTEARRLQACGQLRQLAGILVEGVSEDYNVEGFAELEIVGSANNCAAPEKADSTYLSLKWLLEKNPYRDRRP